MLMLTRRIGEKIIIDGNIKITLLGIDRAQVRLGINAPKHIPIFREEVDKQVQRREKRYKEITNERNN